ncbi:hypothetical protein FJZ19_05340 [Candidatus Pacearchaeota archaeon]|nr:hypothetical protein [Candidatus Pacearchaeota archaeon]
MTQNPELEELVGHAPIFEGKDFGIDENLGYSQAVDSGEFTGNASDLFDVEDYFQKLSDKPHDPATIDDLVGIAVNYHKGSANKGERLQELSEEFNQGNAAFDAAKGFLDAGYRSMARFVERNRDAVLDKLDAKSLWDLVKDWKRVDLYPTGNKEHDRFIALRNIKARMEQVREAGGNPALVIAEEIKPYLEHVPRGQEEYYAKHQHVVIPKLIELLRKALEDAYEKYFNGADGKLDKNKLRAFMEANYKRMEDRLNEVDGDVKDLSTRRGDYWHKNLEPQYVELARRAYAVEKGPYKEKADPEKERQKKLIQEIGGRT